MAVSYCPTLCVPVTAGTAEVSRRRTAEVAAEVFDAVAKPDFAPVTLTEIL